MKTNIIKTLDDMIKQCEENDVDISKHEFRLSKQTVQNLIAEFENNNNKWKKLKEWLINEKLKYSSKCINLIFPMLDKVHQKMAELEGESDE